MEGDEFTFPTLPPPPPAQAEEHQQDLRDLPFPWHSAGTTSAIWPFSTPNATPPTGATTVDEASTSPASRLVQQHAEADDEQDRERAAAEERMDLLWEDFNARELLRRVHSRAASTTDRRAGAPWPGSADGRSPSTSSDAESEETSTSGPRRYGCAPTMLRASSRAGGVGQFYDTNRRRRSRRTTGWTLLLSLFRRLFAVDRTTTTSSHSRSHGIYAP